MEKLQITIDQLKNYLGTGLKCKTSNGEFKNLEGYKSSSEDTGGFEYVYLDNLSGPNHVTILNYIKPLCYRLSDLDKLIPELGFVPIEIITKQGWSTHQQVLLMQKATSHASFELIQLLFQWHFWPFGDEFFEQGLVIDKLNYKTETK